jgi:phosphatidylserine/phosphatidylglycerophosphate/cardiolipin synthase-like enzyme
MRAWALPVSPSGPRAVQGDGGPSSLVHHKFIVRDEADVWTGSANLSPGSLHLQDNDCLIVRSASLAARYLEAFASLTGAETGAAAARAPDSRRQGSRWWPVALPDGEAFAAFAPGDTVDRIACMLIAAARRVRIMAFSITDPRILSALRSACERGADVGGVYDPHGMAEALDERRRHPGSFPIMAGDRFIAAPSRPYSPDREPDFLNHKLIVIDRAVVLTGSANFAGAEHRSADDVIVLRSPSLAARYDDHVEHVAHVYRQGRIG